MRPSQCAYRPLCAGEDASGDDDDALLTPWRPPDGRSGPAGGSGGGGGGGGGRPGGEADRAWDDLSDGDLSEEGEDGLSEDMVLTTMVRRACLMAAPRNLPCRWSSE